MRCLVLALLLVQQASAALPDTTETPVGTPEELMAALAAVAEAQGPGRNVMDVQQGVALTATVASAYELPLQIGANRTLVLRGGNGTMQSLDFGGIPQLLYMLSDSTLVLHTLNLSGSAHKGVLGANFDAAGEFGDGVTMPCRAEAFHLFPTVNGEPGFSAEIRNINLTLAPSPNCSATVVEQQVGAIQHATGSLDTAYAGGTTVHINHLFAPLPVLNSTDGRQIGTMHMNSTDTNSTCTVPPDSDSSGGGTPGWVWAIVALAAAATMAAAAGALLWCRRRATRSPRIQLAAVGVEAGKEAADKGTPSASTPPTVPPSSSGHSSGRTNKSTAPAMAAPALSIPASGEHASGKLDSGELLGGMAWKTRVGFIEGLNLGGVLGGGGYGKVYRGRWKGAVVAVKIIPTHVGPGSSVDLGREPLLSMSLVHPSILPTYKTCVVRVLSDVDSADQEAAAAASSGGGGASAASAGASGSMGMVVQSLTDRNALVQVMPSTAVLEPGLYETWLVCELADLGNLATAITGGLFTSKEGGGVDLPEVMLCLLDIARGLEYLHACNCVHGDLKPQNVLVKSEKRDRRGYVLKLCDFGLSRMLLESQTHVNTDSYGTVSHAAPELLSTGRLTKAADIYAFGLIMHEMLSGSMAFAGIPTFQIITLVTQQGYRPAMPDCPAPLADLMQRCWAGDPRDRPDAKAVVQALKEYAATVCRPKPTSPRKTVAK
ncbi:hypothetical protein ABPG75_007805 [Micractinium tetrahymenae]